MCPTKVRVVQVFGGTRELKHVISREQDIFLEWIWGSKGISTTKGNFDNKVYGNMEFIMGNKEEKNAIFKGSREHSTPFGSSSSLERLVTDFQPQFYKTQEFGNQINVWLTSIAQIFLGSIGYAGLHSLVCCS